VATITARGSDRTPGLVSPRMRDHTTQDHGRRGLWIAAGLIALVVIIALIVLSGGGGGGGGGGGY